MILSNDDPCKKKKEEKIQTKQKISNNQKHLPMKSGQMR